MQKFIFTLIAVVIAVGAGCSSVPNQDLTKQQDPKSSPQEAKKKIDYSFVRGAGQQIQLIAVSNENLNETDMLILGSQLRDENASSDFVRISLFSDSRAADLWDKVTVDGGTDEENSFYDKHYIAQYNKNKTTGLDRYELHLAGLDDENTKTINY
ncbi:MAG: hypothetical protein NUV85_00955 [Candidatus Berkelbacteria bacterium]|nr:hypothetical protein [Candidatus Berkelbacteria bacterium]